MKIRQLKRAQLFESLAEGGALLLADVPEDQVAAHWHGRVPDEVVSRCYWCEHGVALLVRADAG